jgi:putative tryptophan/tyrosine transport system substrate-binding protein
LRELTRTPDSGAEFGGGFHAALPASLAMRQGRAVAHVKRCFPPRVVMTRLRPFHPNKPGARVFWEWFLFHLLIVVAGIGITGHLLQPLPAHAASLAPSSGVVIFVSKNIRPYVAAADGMQETFAGRYKADVRKVFLDRLTERAAADQAARIAADERVHLVAAIGPEAAAFVWNAFSGDFPARIYAIILNPETIIGNAGAAHGISLNIPPAVQLEMIQAGLPSVRRLGIIYDPEINQEFFDPAAEAARQKDIDLIPITVSSPAEIPDILGRTWEQIDGIWLIPDRTVISESIAQYIIKQAVLNKTPVIGYNQFFYDSGAALAFVFDYRDLGRQAAHLAAGLASGEMPDSRRVPVFQVWLNSGVLKTLDINIPDDISPPVRIGP